MQNISRRVCCLGFFTALFLLAPSSRYSIGLQAQERERYGVEILPDWNERVPQQVFQAMSQAGIRWGRVQFDRELVHIGPQQYNWSFTDDIVAQAAASGGVQLLGGLSPSPLWDTTEPGAADYSTYPPRDYNQWADYVFQTVSRYKNYVRFWEVWNEPDVPRPHGWWNGTPAEYARLLAVASREVKRADPNAKVLIGGLVVDGAASVDFFQAIRADPTNPADQYFDIMNIHAYFTRQEARQKVISWRSMTGKPLWVTEMGWPADPQRQQALGDPAFCCGEEAQARFLETVMPELLNLGAEKVFWFPLWMPDQEYEEFNAYGLLDRSFTPRQAYGALRDLLNRLPP